MRTLFATVFIVVLVAAAGAAQAERRMFIISSNAAGHGVDRCLVKGEQCGAAAAAAYCKSQQFADAVSFRKVDRDDITGSIPTSGPGACKGGKCDEFVAIVCTR
jgi:hypothetical protein